MSMECGLVSLLKGCSFGRIPPHSETAINTYMYIGGGGGIGNKGDTLIIHKSLVGAL